jgi:hypothetical protein
VLEFGGTTTVVLAGGGGLLLLMQPANNEAAIAKLAISFTSVSWSFSRHYPRAAFANAVQADSLIGCREVSYSGVIPGCVQSDGGFAEVIA